MASQSDKKIENSLECRLGKSKRWIVSCWFLFKRISLICCLCVYVHSSNLVSVSDSCVAVWFVSIEIDRPKKLSAEYSVVPWVTMFIYYQCAQYSASHSYFWLAEVSCADMYVCMYTSNKYIAILKAKAKELCPSNKQTVFVWVIFHQWAQMKHCSLSVYSFECCGELSTHGISR